jgi:hypothetical protein
MPTQSASLPTEIPTTASASCDGPWVQAHGEGSPDVDAQIRQALAAEQISASVHSSTYGEDGCGVYHVISLDVEVTVQVKSIAERAELEALVPRIEAIVQQIHEQTRVAPNLGQRQIIFVANDTTCRWDAEQRTCQQP